MNTESYKRLALNWLVGKYQTNKYEDEVWFDDNYKNNNNRLQTLMENLYFPFGYNIEGTIQGKTSNNDGIEYSVLYGNYENEQQTTNLGFIMILDNEYNPIQIFKQYSNGEYLGNILSLNVGNDGRFYMVEVDNQGYMRFVLLNNILAKSPTQEEYQLVQRQTYRFDDQNFFNQQNFLMYKHPQNAKYLMVQVQSSGSNIITKAIEFTINVGATNEWKYYTHQKTIGAGGTYWLEQNDLLASWDENNNLTFKSVYTWSKNKNVYYECVNKSQNEDTLTSQEFNLGEILYSQDMLYNTQGIIKNFNTGYIAIYYDDTMANSVAEIYKLDFTNNTYKRIFSDLVSGTNTKGMILARNEGDIFFYYSNYFDDPGVYQSYVGIIVGENIYRTLMMTDVSYTQNDLLLVNVQKQFNLYGMYIQIGNNVYIGKLLYIDKDNNRLYTDYTSLTPNFITLFNEDGYRIFARTLYNKNINGSTTTSSVQIPNQLLNDISINSQKLGSKTYYILTTSNNPFTKNQYEEVYVNFANTWGIQNQNDPNNVVLNISGATRFNQSISGTNDYSNCKATKFRLNYNDNTSAIFSFTSDEIVKIDNNPPYTYRYSWSVFNPVEKNISSIDIISEDEQTIFQTINNLNLENGKLYALTQDVYVI